MEIRANTSWNGQLQTAGRLIRFARKTPRQQLQIVRARVRYRLLARIQKVPHVGNDRTTYVIGLFGSGRSYINELLVQNIGERAKYFRDRLCFHHGPTSMIYSGHATVKYVSGLQDMPVQTSHILAAVKAGFADLIFIYRHPLDSLLTNWVWWRTYIREPARMIQGISEVYKDRDELCSDLEQDFLEFESFAKGDPDFFAALPYPRFLSFPEFVEETELLIRAATIAVRLEDFVIDPFHEFLRIARIISVDRDFSRLQLAPPRARPYGYLAIRDKVPQFCRFIKGLDMETRHRIERMGYQVDRGS